ncbi:MAG: DUF853 domain-containing protein [bacterium]|nr:DUF853 domain-containing protein [bacterium]
MARKTQAKKKTAKKSSKKTKTKTTKKSEQAEPELSEKQRAAFEKKVAPGYTHKGPQITLGAAVLDGVVTPEVPANIPLKTLNRHGLIAGATGTGKTKTLQIIAGELSAVGVPSLLMDIKGDLSGIAQPGEEKDFITKRHAGIGIDFESRGYPVEFFTLSGEKGARLRATVAEFGPILLSKILDLNETQSGILAVVFQYCDNNGLLLLDLPDLKKALMYVAEGHEDVVQEYGKVSKASAGTILRKIVALEQQEADIFFGERSFDVEDLVRINEDGEGMVSVLRLTDVQSKPALFSTFMLQLLAEVYEKFPEEGDLDRPKLAIFVDEAHLVFSNASKVLLEQIEMIVKLVRSKGVGIFFVTQNPGDIPASVLGQLGLKVQHALRAFTAKDRKNIKLAAENFPLSNFYDAADLLTTMGIGEAMITGLSEKGKPTPLIHCMLRAPASRMDVLTEAELDEAIAGSELREKYNEVVDRESAYEILSKKIEDIAEQQEAAVAEKTKAKKSGASRRRTKAEKSTLEKIASSPLTKQIGRTVAREVTRGLLGVLGISTTRRRRRKKSSSWF